MRTKIKVQMIKKRGYIEKKIIIYSYLKQLQTQFKTNKEQEKNTQTVSQSSQMKNIEIKPPKSKHTYGITTSTTTKKNIPTKMDSKL